MEINCSLYVFLLTSMVDKLFLTVFYYKMIYGKKLNGRTKKYLISFSPIFFLHILYEI